MHGGRITAAGQTFGGLDTQKKLDFFLHRYTKKALKAIERRRPLVKFLIFCGLLLTFSNICSIVYTDILCSSVLLLPQVRASGALVLYERGPFCVLPCVCLLVILFSFPGQIFAQGLQSFTGCALAAKAPTQSMFIVIVSKFNIA